MLNKILSFKVWLAAVLLAGASGAAYAAYPDQQPIRVVLPYSPGAASDIVMRVIQPFLAEELGQTIVLEYKSGAGGNIGSQYVARAEPDGYTLLLGATNNFVINQFLYKDMGYDPLKDLAPVTKVVDVPAFIYMNTQVPAKNFAEFKAYAHEHPGTLNYGTPGAGTTPALSGWMLSEAIGGKMVAVQYRGSGPGVQALLSNEIQVYIGGYGIAASYLSTGKIVPLAVAAQKRFEALPDVPTTHELGIGQAVVSNWWGLAAPAGTSPDIINTLNAAMQKVLANPEVEKKMTRLGFVVNPSSAEQFQQNLAKEAPYWQDVINKAGVKIN
ncbi:tripartite tricarboxylate transporter substrate binding protein [Allopusillimonas soli]|uniref:Tripartite tricarboxylate transporter substrate binding protein n=1 Tax=Allopusillimonas soli TaxID=659016 RepID=A0A853FDI5_9BURK|nr:tripartite tricarboxylate transporter substrate binding protein [Allopusillimonas soli]NYT38133.1 tripartite tricarboxylate transporter substrate binding protein [Allopusillimonas soli]TEA74010.1 tripartite tricarboxylate transporter substrate binding protein [Allopusillimonas soli]